MGFSGKGLTLPSMGRPQAGFAHLRPPLMSNVRAQIVAMDKKLERSNKEKVLRQLAKNLASAGFRRTKPTFFTRLSLPVIEFVHLHKFTFEPSFRIHLGIRVVNDPLSAVALNGATSDEYRGQNSPAGVHYNFRFHEAQETLDRCASNVAEFISTIAEPWFQSCRNHEALASSPKSPLNAEARAALARALAGQCEEAFVAKTKELLNVP